MNEPMDWALRLCLSAPLFLLALTIHEVAHAWMAKRCGDPTAEEAGRLTLDPLVHLDPVGTLMFAISAAAGYGFGWARPVPVRLENCREPLRAMFWIAAAGPASNLLQAIVAVLALLLLGLAGAPLASTAFQGVTPILEGDSLGLVGILACLVSYYLHINLILMIFNLLPIPPLDGGRILVSVLPYRMAATVAALERYGFLIILVAWNLIGRGLGEVLYQLDLALLALLRGLGLV